MVTIYLIRHGETNWNNESKFQGFTNNSLNDKGKKQAELLAHYLKDIKLDAIFCSTLLRSKQTANEIGKHHKDTKISVSSRITEIDGGIFEGLTKEERRNKYPLEYAARKKDKYDYKIPKGESYSNVLQRIKPILEKIKRLSKDNVIVIVGHQCVNRVMTGFLLNLSKKETAELNTPSTTIFKLEINGETKLKKIKL